MKLGLLSDLHHEPAPPTPRRWINAYDPANVLARVAAALAWFAAEAVDRVVVAGDLVEVAKPDAYDDVLQTLTVCALPVGLVGGNHDWSDDGLLARKSAEHGCRLLDGVTDDGIGGVAAAPTPLFHSTARPADEARVIVSHFPVLSEATALADAGLPYPGDLTDRAELAAELKAAGAPRLVLSGHIHARCSRAQANLLQLSTGALIEPPHEAAIVTIGADGTEVERRVRRFGPAAAVEPVFAAAYEQWRWQDAWTLTMRDES